MIARLKLEIEKLRRELYGHRSVGKARLLDQLEMQLKDLEANATEDELAATAAAIQSQTVRSFERKQPSRKPFPEHLPREDITETLEMISRQWKVVKTVPEPFSCR